MRGVREHFWIAARPMPGRFYVTTPIYYVNDVPHVGHAYTTIAADTIARWHRLNGRSVKFLTGTDEHGQKVLRAAESRGRTPQEHVNLLVEPYKALWAALGIAYDDFIRTTEPRHQRVVGEMLTRLHENGEIYISPYSGWYSTSAERFWKDEELVDGKCPDTGQPVEWITERNYFFRMSAYQERLIRWIEEHPGCIRPENRANEVLGFLRKPLGDLCISRPKARLPWGIPLPFDDEYVTYVWFDALTNYVSALGEERAEWWPADVHLVGKDILTFHTVYWFSMLFAMGLEPPRSVYAHGWWTVRRQKMSKSAGNMVDPHALIGAYGADAVRYFLLREIPFGGDGDFSPEAILTRYNADLANDLGNLAHRSLTMAERWLGGQLPAAGPMSASDRVFLDIGARATATFRASIEQLQFRDALDGLWEFVRAGNKYIDTEAPWALAKKGDTARLAAVLRNALECVRIAASHLWCVCPQKATELLAKLGEHMPSLVVSLDGLPTAARVAAGEPLFPRMEAEPTSSPAVAPPSPKEPPVPDPTPVAQPVAPSEVPALIEYGDFAKLALRTGVIVQADRHPNADRLLVLKVDVGEAEPRTIVAGIAAVYAPDQLVGQPIIVVVNLKPAKLRGVESNGMLLAAGGPTVASLLTTITNVPPGTIVK